MSITAIIQARLGSTRLPGKVLKPLAGYPALWHLLNRLKYSKTLEQVVVATTTQKQDDAIEQFCLEHGVLCFRGSEEDVLDRYYQAAKHFRADPIMRITADCPLIDPVIIDEVVQGYFEGGYDLYGLGGEYPDGLDCVVFSFRVLEETWSSAELPSEREHVCPYMIKHPEKFKLEAYKKFKGLGYYRWTLDEEADLCFLQEVFDRLYQPGEIFLTQDILDLLNREPSLRKINSFIIRDEGYIRSLKKDEGYLRNKQNLSLLTPPSRQN